MKGSKTKKGISLITLVITIIVVIVLAAAVILTLNNNNPVENAKEATFKSDVATVQDDLNLYVADKYAKVNGAYDVTTLNLSDETDPTIANELKSVDSSKLKGKVEVQGGKLVFTGEDETEKKWFNEIIAGGTNTPIPPLVPGEVVSKNTPYESDGKIAIIPKGFKVSTVSAEQSIDMGLVIIAPDESEFVWVPVPDITVHIDKENNRSRLYSWSKVDGIPTQVQLNGTEITHSVLGYREPDIVTLYDNNQNMLNQMNSILGTNFTVENQEFKAYIQKEWEDIYKSVETNKGFYIGRYETGNIVDSDDATVVSKKNQNDLGTVNNMWYRLYAKQRKYASTLEGTSIKSNMIYGFEYDAAMKWFITSSDENVRKIPINSDNEYANFSDEKKATGSTKAVNNIYDMSGNVWEWTAAANDNDHRAKRGGQYGSSNSVKLRCAGYLDSIRPTYADTVHGSRLGLYL